MQDPHMPAAQGYAVVSCHVERPFDDEVWRRYLDLIRRRPGGFPIASLMRPPMDGEDGAVFVERAREAAALGPFGHHIHWTSPTHARPTGPDPAGALRREGEWLREQGLKPRFFCGGGWYTDADVMSAVADLGYVDCTATAWRPAVPAGWIAPRRARTAGLGQARRRPPGARASDHALARRRGEGARRVAAAGYARPLPRLRAARREKAHRARLTSHAARQAPPSGRPRRPRGRPTRSAGTPYAPADPRRRRSRRSRAAAPSRRRSGSRSRCRRIPSASRSSRTAGRSSPRTRVRAFASRSRRTTTSTR